MTDPVETSNGREPSSQLARLGCLLPILATALFLAILFGWPTRRHQPSDLQVVFFFVSMVLVPIAGLAGIVLSVIAFVRARRVAAGGASGWLRLMAVIAVALGSVALTALVIWAALTGLR